MRNLQILKLIALSLCPWCLCGGSPSIAADRSPLPRFERIVIDADFPGGYQVEVADVNGDGKPDVVGVGGGTCAWYENPSWKKRIVSSDERTPKIISSATRDIDGDGQAEIAIAYDFEMNEPTRGKLALASPGSGPDAPWSLTPIADVGSIHRLRWGDLGGDGTPDLLVAPIFGPAAKPPAFDQDPARLRVFRTHAPKSGRWDSEVIGRAPVLHAVAVGTFFGRGRSQVLTAGNDGVQLINLVRDSREGPPWLARPLVPGAPGRAPKRGSSEVHLGHLGRRTFLVTIDPWHGGEVAVCLMTDGSAPEFGPRAVIDDTLDEGHALWVADVDGDGDDEIFAGHRGKDARVSAYDFDGNSWDRTVLDATITAQDLRGGDLDGDGTPDVVAIGGKSHNVVWYRPVVRKP